jgi:hypothetical protein
MSAGRYSKKLAVVERSKMAQKGRLGTRTIATEFPFVVETKLPPEGFGKRLAGMYQFHMRREIQAHHLPRRHDDAHDYLRWCFADRTTAETFAAEFSGTVLLPK